MSKIIYLFIKIPVANKGDAQLDLILLTKMLTETNVLVTVDTSSEEDKKIEPGFSWCCMLGGTEVKGRS